MNHRTAFLLVFVASTGLGLASFACSSSTSSGGGTDNDSGTGDATTDSGSHKDGASDTGSQDGGGMDSAPDVTGNCSPVNGPACDIVLQNCPTGKECVAVRASDGGFTTACNPTSVGEHIAKGEPCSTQSPNPCLPGLECFGGRCTPHCCTGNDSVCGSTSQGVAGTCDLQISGGSGSGVLFEVCTYRQTCKPFGALPCPTGESCNIADNNGTSNCSGTSTNGKTEGQNCMFANDCVDGEMCLGPQGGQATCKMLCIPSGQMPPFDAGADGGPFKGGCNTGKTCSGALNPQQFPTWVGFCQ